MSMPAMTRTLPLAAAMVMGIACQEPLVSPSAVANVSVSPSPATVLVGGTKQLVVRLEDAAGNVLTGRVVTWASGNTAVATVSGAGLATGVAVGSATITATAEGKNGTAAVTVTVPPSVSVASVTVAPATVLVGVTVQLTATTKDAAGNVLTGRTVTWVTSNPGVATVNSTGLATGVAAGRATITAISEGQSGTAAVPVAVAGGHSFSALSTGYDHTCARTANGTAYCWGGNQFGQLGTGPAGGPQFCVDNFPCSTVPAAVSGGLTFAAVSAGTGVTGFTCGLTPGGAAYCWGDNGDGGLGNGTPTNRLTPLAVGGGFSLPAVGTGRPPHLRLD